ncbi:Reverse transcriptase (RNA-dependent DNA polymerase) [Fragilaria crotonensis]|nr:Reverse transcriptase (RNA-dependent DNA polymerase) [Fragilaria crotonensis]
MSNPPSLIGSTVTTGGDSSRRGQYEGATRGTSGGRGRNSGRGRGNQNRNNRSRGGNNATKSNRASTFKGNTEGMNGHVFECAFEQGDKRQYVKTVEALEGYGKKNLKYSEDFASLFAFEPSEPTIEKPVDLPPDHSTTDEMIWKEEIKAYVNRMGILRSNLAALFAVALGQCSDAMKAKLKLLKEYEARYKKNDCMWLLKNILSITLQFDQRRNGYLAIMDAHQNFLNCKQAQDQTTEEYLENLVLWADTIEYHGGSFVENFRLASASGPGGELRTEEERRSAARDETLAMALIRGADPTRYGTLLAELSNQFALGRNDYPTDLNAAYSLLVNYRTPVNAKTKSANAHTSNTGAAALTAEQQQQTSANTTDSAMTFTQRTNGTGEATVVTTTPENAGPAPPSSTSSVNTGTTLVQYAVMMTQAEERGIDPNWILLDSQSTISVFRNKDMLCNVRRSPHILRAITNGGHQDSSMIGDFPNLGPVWYNERSIANILSLADVRKVCTVTMDTSKQPAINVKRKDGSIMSFVEHPSGLYVYDGNQHPNSSVTAYTLVSTVADQKKLFSRRQIEAADAARALYRKIGRPDEAEFQTILQNNWIRNCPVTPDDAKRALLIYGPDIAVLKGKMTRSGAEPSAPTFRAVQIPAPILEHHSDITLCVDFFFVQGVGFLHTISRGIGFRTVAPVADRTRATILKEITSVISLYQDRGFRVCDVHADNEFECIRNAIRPTEMNIVPADGHVGEVERSIRTIKERLRTCVHGLPFKRLPKIMIRHMVIDVVRCLNQFPRKHGVSTTMSPATIVIGSGTPDFAAMRLEFGAYVQVFEDLDPTNTPRARSLGAIALNPTGNAQGDYYFMSLATGARLSRHRWIEVPIPDTAIARVEALAIEDGQPLIQEAGLVVEWRPDQPIDESEYDRDYVPPNQNDDDVFDITDYDPIDATELPDLAADNNDVMSDAERVPEAVEHEGADDRNETDEAADHSSSSDESEYYDRRQDDADGDSNDWDTDGHGEDDNYISPAEENADEDQEAVEDVVTDGVDPHQGAPEQQEQVARGDVTNHPRAHPTYNLRERVTRTNTFKTAIDEPHSQQSYLPPQHQMFQKGYLRDQRKFAFEYVLSRLINMTKTNKLTGYTLAQMSAKAGIRRFGKAAEAALMKEFAQMEDLTVYEPIHAIKLTKEQRKAALRVLSLIQQKRCGTIKSRTVADGRPQRALYDRSETASPTVSTDGLLLSIIIDAYESRDVAIADVAGAYLKAFMKDFVIMKFTGEMVGILCKLNPKYKEFIVMEGGTPVIYVRLIKAIYGCVKSALLWYETFSGTLQQMGFVLNPYDKCVANCEIQGKQCTIAWYVDDMKISHEDPNVVTSIIEKLEGVFGKMSVTRGASHVFLGMNITFNKRNRTAEIIMKDYLTEAIEESGLNIDKTAATPASKELYDIDPQASPLERTPKDRFHSVVAKLLYVSIRARMDLLLATSFLTTRISTSTSQDQSKLKRLLEYVQGTLDMPYVVGADDLGRMRTWVDAAYAVHPDMRSQTGGVISFGRGGIVCKSSKQKLNTKSSTEAEFVGASDYLPNTIWVKLFMESQGHQILQNILEQDNESAIKLEKNGRTSAGQKSRHINIRYFWVKDRTEAENIQIRHCPTEHMLADFFTKPLQGNMFRRFRAVVLGHNHTDTLASIATTTDQSEERVGRSNFTARSKQSDSSDRVSDNSIGTGNSTTLGLDANENPHPTSVSWADVVKGRRGTKILGNLPYSVKEKGLQEIILSK